MAVPRGWQVDDRREAVPRLFLAPATGEPPVPAAKVRHIAEKSNKQERHRAVEPAAELFDKADDVPELDETRAMPWSPKLIESLDDQPTDGGSADEAPRGGLLARAFGNKDRRERS